MTKKPRPTVPRQDPAALPVRLERATLEELEAALPEAAKTWAGREAMLVVLEQQAVALLRRAEEVTRTSHRPGLVEAAERHLEGIRSNLRLIRGLS